MIVEFIGTPGSGKTTLLPLIIDILSDLDITGRTIVNAARPVVSRTASGKFICRYLPTTLQDPLLWQVFYYRSYLARGNFYREYPELVSHVRTSQQNRALPAADRQHVLYWWFHLIGYYQFLKPRLQPGEALLLDEGFVHRVVQLGASDHEDIDQGHLITYLDLIPKPDLLVFVDAPVELCEQRVYQRGLWERFQDKTPLQVSQYIANSQRVVNFAIDQINSRDWPIIEVENSGEQIDLVRHELQDRLPEIIDQLQKAGPKSTS